MLVKLKLEVSGNPVEAPGDSGVAVSPDTDSDAGCGVTIDPALCKLAVEAGESFIVGDLLSNQREPAQVTQRTRLHLSACAVHRTTDPAARAVMLRLPKTETEGSIFRLIDRKPVTAGVGDGPVVALHANWNTQPSINFRRDLKPDRLRHQPMELLKRVRLARRANILQQPSFKESPIPRVGGIPAGFASPRLPLPMQPGVGSDASTSDALSQNGGSGIEVPRIEPAPQLGPTLSS